MKCPRCNNDDQSYFYYGSKGWYCRKCISFKRILVLNNEKEIDDEIKIVDGEYQLRFELTDAQKNISHQILNLTKQNESVLVNAVCGAGKTELVYETIKYCLNNGKRIGFAISRRQVVLQLAKRIREDFPTLEVIPVCEGYTYQTKGQMIICTTHQLYRYLHYFDVLIIDEPDAFPFDGNEVLQGISENAVRGTTIYLTATPSKWILDKDIKKLSLNERPSKVPLAIPKVRYGPKILLWIYLLIWLKKNKRQILCFFPSIKILRILKILGFKVISSKSNNKEKIINEFLNKKIRILCTTTILERGVTFPGIDVCVMYSDHQVFSCSSLVQIMGRVGRDVKDPYGEGMFLCRKRSQEVDKCIKIIKKANEDAYGVDKI